MKKLLLSLFVGLFGLIGFSNSAFLNVGTTYTRNVSACSFSDGYGNYFGGCNVVGRMFPVVLHYDCSSISFCSDYTCSSVVAGNNSYVILKDVNDKVYYTGTVCSVGVHLYSYNDTSIFSNNCPSTGEILSGYILESDITQNYCEVEFGLITPENCPSYGSGEGTGEIMWSSFYVNDEQILGGANIYLTIPDYLKWDYIYVDQDLEIDVENEGDEEYIQGIIDINSYRPTSDDFTDIFVSGLTLIMPYIVIILFIVFVWKLIKRIFK